MASEIPQTHTRALATYTVFLLDLEDVATIPASHFLRESTDVYEGLLPEVAERDSLMFETILGIITAHILSTALPPIFAPAFTSENPLVQVKGTIRLVKEEETLSWLKTSLENMLLSIVIENAPLIDDLADDLSEITEKINTLDEVAALQELSPHTYIEIYRISTQAGRKLLKEIPLIITPTDPMLKMMLELYSSVAVGVQTSLVLSLKTEGWDEEKELTISKFTTYMIAYKLSKIFAPYIYNPSGTGMEAIEKLIHGNIIRSYAEILRKSVEIMEDMNLSGISWRQMREDSSIFPEVLKESKEGL